MYTTVARTRKNEDLDHDDRTSKLTCAVGPNSPRYSTVYTNAWTDFLPLDLTDDSVTRLSHQGNLSVVTTGTPTM